MAFSIKNDYSLLNCYEYKNKSTAMSALDFLSAPCRRILGGRNVSVMAQTYDHPYGSGLKVFTAVLSILIAPVGIISLASLIIKAMTMPFIWEKKIIKGDTDKAFKVIDQFNQAFKDNKPDEALKIYRANKAIGSRSDVYPNLYEIVRQKVTSGGRNWNEIQTLLPMLGTNDKQRLLNIAIKQRLDSELANDHPCTSGAEIRNFINHSLGNHDLKEAEKFYEFLFEGALQLKPEDKLLTRLNKAAIADDLAKSLKTRIRDSANDQKDPAIRQLIIGSVDTGDYVLRLKLMDGLESSEKITYQVLINNQDKIQPISNTLEGIRILSKTTKQAWDILNEKEPATKARWDTVRGVYSGLAKQLPTICSTAEEKAYLEAAQKSLATMIQFGDTIWEADSADKIQAFTKQFEVNCENEKQTIEGLFNDINLHFGIKAGSNTYEQMNYALRFKKNSELTTLIEIIKTCLHKDMCQAAVKRFETATL